MTSNIFKLPWHNTLYAMAPHFETHGILAETNVLNAEGLIGDVVKVQTVAENPGEAPNPPFPVDFFRGIYGSFREGIKFTYIYCKMQ